MDQIISLLSVIPLRKEPDHRSEQVSQLLFGEMATIFQAQNGWLNIESSYDNYSGWVEENPVQLIVDNHLSEKRMILAEPFLPVWTDDHQIILPAGSEIPIKSPHLSFNLANHLFTLSEPLSNLANSLTDTASKFLHAPYLWGGRTVFGIDCSGLVQIVYKIHGKKLPRDTKDQAKSGKTVEYINDALPGDLFFFGLDPEKISHVGIFLGDNRIIHASKSVRIDTVGEKGIFNNELQQYTHQFQLIRRVIK